jgi:hypothetical protein
LLPIQEEFFEVQGKFKRIFQSDRYRLLLASSVALPSRSEEPTGKDRVGGQRLWRNAFAFRMPTLLGSRQQHLASARAVVSEADDSEAEIFRVAIRASVAVDRLHPIRPSRQ